VLLAQQYLETTSRRITRDTGAIDASTDDDDVKLG
jgi:hypothetical protein